MNYRSVEVERDLKVHLVPSINVKPMGVIPNAWQDEADWAWNSLHERPGSPNGKAERSALHLCRLVTSQAAAAGVQHIQGSNLPSTHTSETSCAPCQCWSVSTPQRERHGCNGVSTAGTKNQRAEAGDTQVGTEGAVFGQPGGESVEEWPNVFLWLTIVFCREDEGPLFPEVQSKKIVNMQHPEKLFLAEGEKFLMRSDKCLDGVPERLWDTCPCWCSKLDMPWRWLWLEQGVGPEVLSLHYFVIPRGDAIPCSCCLLSSNGSVLGVL